MTDAWTLLQARRRTRPGEPFVTHVDGFARSRTELSATSLENAAAKIANALRDEFDLDAGSTIALHLPVHWQRSAWCAGAWAAGCAVRLDDALDDVDLLVTDEVTAIALAGATALDIAVVSLHPLGLPVGGSLPAGAMDVTLSVRQQPDAYLYDPPTGDCLALLADGVTLDQAGVLDLARRRAEAWGLARGGRLLADDRLDLVDGWLAAFAAPLVVDGSVVLASSVTDADELLSQERVSAHAG